MQKQEEKKMEKSQDGRERGTDARQKTNLNCCLSCDENITFFSFFRFFIWFIGRIAPRGMGIEMVGVAHEATGRKFERKRESN